MPDEFRLTVPEERNSWERNQQTADAMIEKSKVRGKPKAGVAPEKDQDKRNQGNNEVDTL